MVGEGNRQGPLVARRIEGQVAAAGTLAIVVDVEALPALKRLARGQAHPLGGQDLHGEAGPPR